MPRFVSPASWSGHSGVRIWWRDKETAVKAVRWPRAFDAANRAGFSKLGDIGAANFEIRLERHPV